MDSHLMVHPALNSVADRSCGSLFDRWVKFGEVVKQPLTAHLPGGEMFDEVLFMENIRELAYDEVSIPDDIEPIQTVSARWLHISNMQKAIRVGAAETAARSAISLLRAGHGDHMWRRLAIVAGEDVGIGDPYACLAVLLCRMFPWAMKDEAVLALMCVLLSQAPKSRTVCDLTEAPRLGGVWESEYQKYCMMPLDQVVQLSLDSAEELPAYHHMLMVASYFGKEWKDDFIHSLTPIADKNKRAKFWKMQKYPPLLERLCFYSSSHGYSRFAASWPVGWSYMLESNDLSVGKDYFDGGDGVVIGDVLSSALDMHTQPGKRSIAYLTKSCPKWSDGLPKKVNAFQFLSTMLFYVEGATLRPCLRSTVLDELYWWVLRVTLEGEGWSDWTKALEIYYLAAEDLSPAHYARARVTGTRMPKR